MPIEKPREIATRVLTQVSQSSLFVEELLDRMLQENPMQPPNRALCQELVYGILRSQSRLDWIIARYTQNRTQKLGLQLLLRLGLYQLFFLDRIPPHAAVNEAVDQARRTGFGPQSGFINAVLRQAVRDADKLRAEMKALESTDPATAFSHPAWLVERWMQAHGNAATLAMLAANNRSSTTFARVNLLKATAEKLIERWREEGVEYDFRTYPWTGENVVFALRHHPPLNRLPSFQEGWFYIQDPSTLLAVDVLDPQPGESVLDLCAAPGGKTCFIAQRMQNSGVLVAMDEASDRLPRLKENCARLGAGMVTVSKTTGMPAASSEAVQEFDRVLVDAPCSNTGVIGRRIELRHRIQPAEIVRLQAVQSGILEQAARLVKPNGVLVYSTCSVEPEENQLMVRAFVSRHPGFQLKLEQQVLPGAADCDGAYVAKLVRG